MIPRPIRALLALAAPLTLAGCALVESESNKPPAPEFVVSSEPMKAWDALFPPTKSPWGGSDSVVSVPLGPERLLWLFGESPVAPPGAPARRVGNSIATQGLLRKGEQIRPLPPEFFWKIKQDLGASEVFRPDAGGGWLRPLSGFLDGDRLFLFFIQLAMAKGGEGAAPARNVALTIDGVDGHPNQWRPVDAEIPFFKSDASGFQAFGQACLVQKDAVYLYGLRDRKTEKGWWRGLVLARFSSDDLTRGDFERWSFFNGKEWSPNVAAAADLCPMTAAEFSVSYLPSAGKFALVYGEKGPPSRVLARFGARPEGPWGEPVTLIEFETPTPGAARARAHPALTGVGSELAVCVPGEPGPLRFFTVRVLKNPEFQPEK